MHIEYFSTIVSNFVYHNNRRRCGFNWNASTTKYNRHLDEFSCHPGGTNPHLNKHLQANIEMRSEKLNYCFWIGLLPVALEEKYRGSTVRFFWVLRIPDRWEWQRFQNSVLQLSVHYLSKNSARLDSTLDEELWFVVARSAVLVLLVWGKVRSKVLPFNTQ